MLRTALRLCIAGLLAIPAPARADEQLSVDPVIQQTPVWCWAAVSEMVLGYYGVENASPVGNFQCAIVGAAGAMSGAKQCYFNCGMCIVSAESAGNLIRWLEGYSEIASQFLNRQLNDVDASYRSHEISWEDLITQIEGGNPVIAGISPGVRISMRGGSQHVALIIGYEDDGQLLIVNDPFPFPLMPGWTDPYVAAGGQMLQLGQYRVPYANFVQSLNWRESILVEEAG